MCRDCPNGFVLRKLEEHHAEVISPFWTHSDSVEAKENYFKSLIKKFHSVGVFSVTQDQDTPIAWCLQHPFGQPGHLYVIEKYRKQGFASLVLEHLCKCIQEDGLVPEICCSWSNIAAKGLMKKLGFVEYEKHKILTISNNKNYIKSVFWSTFCNLNNLIICIRHTISRHS